MKMLVVIMMMLMMRKKMILMMVMTTMLTMRQRLHGRVASRSRCVTWVICITAGDQLT